MLDKSPFLGDNELLRLYETVKESLDAFMSEQGKQKDRDLRKDGEQIEIPFGGSYIPNGLNEKVIGVDGNLLHQIVVIKECFNFLIQKLLEKKTE